MLVSIEVTSNQGANLTLPFGDGVGGFRIQDIEGLDPVKANLVSSSFANMDGVQYQSSRREARNLVLKLGLEPDYSIETTKDLRNRLYSFFMPKTEVTLTFVEEGGEEYSITGRVETFDAPLLTREPTATIAMMCMDPDFRAPEPISFTGGTTDEGTEYAIDYNGSIETGIRFRINVDRVIDGFVINQRSSSEATSNSLNFRADMVAGDVVDISTVSGDKSAMLLRSTADYTSETSILYGILPHSNWINLFPGTNYIRVYAEGATIPFTIEYTEKFGGL